MLGFFVIVLLIMIVIATALVFIFSYVEPVYFNNGTGHLLRKFSFIVAAILVSSALADILRGLNYIYTLVFLSVTPAILYVAFVYPLNLNYEISLENIIALQYGLLFLIPLLVIIKLKPILKYDSKISKEVFLENKTNGRPIYFGGLAGVATTHLAGFSISYYLDNTQVGFYMLALTMCSPLLVIPSVLGTAYFKQFAVIRKIPVKIILLTLIISLLAIFIFLFIIEDVIIYFYTERYLPVSGIAKILIISFLFHGLGDLINRFLGAKGKGKILRNAAFIVGAVNIIGYTLLANFFGMNGVVLTRVLGSLTYLLLMWLYYKNFIRNSKNVQK
ncbi:hypothetical protein [Maribacter aestuarii]|uniref:hypothetical protein n=1 Tax=Maribacter aestuarii TaxID=1130723 RepID=UPI00248BA371|nr:hypothetical protein [Maribacter aestuarii]